MTPLQGSALAAFSFAVGWGVHVWAFEPAAPRESTTPSTAQRQQAAEAARERLQAAPDGEGVIAPLNVRDPSALVMPPMPRPASCAPLKPCDCTAERLKKARREQPERF